MAKTKLNFRRLPVAEKVAKAQQIVTALNGNTSFPTPSPSLAAITTATNDLDSSYTAAQAARQDAKTKTSVQNEKEDVLDRLMSQLVGYVGSVAGDDDTLIRSAGMDTRAPATATGTPEVPAALSATAGDHDSEVDLSWDPVTQARSYVVEQSADPPAATSWAHAGVSTKSTTTIKNLTSRTRYWWRVAAVGTAGQSGWSDPATRIAP